MYKRILILSSSMLFLTAFAMERVRSEGSKVATTPPPVGRKKALLNATAMATYQTLADDALRSKKKEELEHVMEALRSENRVSMVDGNPNFFVQLSDKLQAVLFALPVAPLIDGPEEIARQQKEAAEKRLEENLNQTVFLQETGATLQPGDPLAPTLAAHMQRKHTAKGAELEQLERERAEALNRARETAQRIEKLRKDDAALEDAILHVAQANPEAVDHALVAGIKEKREQAQPFPEKKGRMTWPCIVS